MKTWLPLLAAAALLAVVVWSSLAGRDDPAAPRPVDVGVAPPPGAGPALESPDLDAGSERTAIEAAQAGTTAALPARLPPPATGALVVDVRTASGAPAPDVAVDVRRSGRGLPAAGLARVRTDADGVARFPALPAGPVTVQGERRTPGEWTRAEVVRGEERRVELVLPAGVAVVGRVVDAGGRPVAGAGIWLTSGATDWQGGHVVARAGPDGGFALEDVPPTQSLGALAPGNAPSALVDLDDRDTTVEPVRIELALTGAGGALAGTVRDADGAPVAGALVGVGDSAPWFAQRLDSGWTEAWTPRVARTDGAGRFALAGLAPGEHAVRVRADAWPVWKGSARVRAGETTALEIALDRGVVVAGTVRDADGEPVAGAVLRAFDEPLDERFLQFGQFNHKGTFGYPCATSDAAGRYALRALPPGALELYASPPTPERTGFEAVVHDHRSLAAADGSRYAWDPVLSEGHVIAGVATYRDGLPIGGTFLAARDEVSGKVQSVITDPEGRFRLLNLANAPHTLGLQLWDAPGDASPVEVTDVWPDRGAVRLVAGFDAPAAEEEGRVTGRVDDAAGRAAGAGALSVVLESGRRFTRVDVDMQGDAFTFEAVAPGTYTPVVLAGDDAIHVGAPFDLAPGERRDLGTLVTEPGGSLRLVIERLPGSEDVEALLHLAPEGSMHGRRVTIGRATELVVENLSAGSYTAGLYGEGALPAGGAFTLAGGEEAALALRLEAAARMVVEITWPEGRPTGPLHVRIEGDDGRPRWDRRETNVAFLERPYVLRPQLPLGRFTLSAETETGMRGSLSFEVERLGEQPAPVRLELR